MMFNIFNQSYHNGNNHNSPSFSSNRAWCEAHPAGEPRDVERRHHGLRRREGDTGIVGGQVMTVKYGG